MFCRHQDGSISQRGKYLVAKIHIPFPVERVGSINPEGPERNKK